MQENKIKNLLENIDLQINFLTEDLTTVTTEKAEFEANSENGKRTKAYKNKANELKLQEEAIYSQIYFFAVSCFFNQFLPVVKRSTM